MRKVLRIALSVLAGLVVGSAINMALVLLGGKLVPPPPGADVSTTEGLRAAMPLFEARHFVFPFLAHALGTVFGAFFAALFAPVRPKLAAMIVGVFFLAGGVANVLMLPSPAWFTALDLLLAYLPAAAVGFMLGQRLRALRESAPAPEVGR
jgi:hypothetical protein